MMVRPERTIIGELSGNHAGELSNCLRLISEVRKLGAIPKLQCFNPAHLARKRLNNPAVTSALGHRPEYTELLQLYQTTHTPYAWWPRLLKELSPGPWSCSVFSLDDLELMLTMQCPILKIASFEIRDVELIDDCAQHEVPLVISANRHATPLDISDAIDAAQDAPELTVLYATDYCMRPLTPAELQTEIERMTAVAELIEPWAEWGISDHTQDLQLATVALERGASMVEKHICLPDCQTPDSAFSFSPTQMAELVGLVR